MPKKAYIVAVCLGVSAILTLCQLTKNEEGGSLPIESARIEDNDVQSWTEEKELIKFNSNNMYDLVNGGAVEYIDNGMIEGFQQKMGKAGTGYYFIEWLMDFGSAENASEMYTKKLNQFQSSKEAAGDFPESVAFLDNGLLYGYDAYAHFGKYFLWLNFDGYGANKSEAKQNAIGFLIVIKSKIDALQ